jgi:hypothetical protein
VRLLGVGAGAGLQVRDNSAYLGFPALLENLQLTTTAQTEMDEGRYFSTFWGAGRDVVLKDCTIVGSSGTPLVMGGPGTLLEGGPFRCAAIRCTIDASRNGIFATMQRYSITRFLGCTFAEPTCYRAFDFMLEKEADETYRGYMALLVRRNRFPGYPVVHDLGHAASAGPPQYFILF